jgi:hypothetical protein
LVHLNWADFVCTSSWRNTPPASALSCQPPGGGGWVAIQICFCLLKVIEKHLKSMREACEKLDALCPRWASCVTETSVSDDAARLMFSKNKNILRIPDAIRALLATRAELTSVCEVFAISDTDHKLTKTEISQAQNTDKFARKTVTVAAGIKALLQDATSEAASNCLDKLKAALPQGLVLRLEALMGITGEEEPAAKRQRVKKEPLPSVAAAAAAAVDASGALLEAKKEAPRPKRGSKKAKS